MGPIAPPGSIRGFLGGGKIPTIWTKSLAFGIGKGLRLVKASPPSFLHFVSMSDDLTLLERAVPRYTSYPTAPHFSAQVGADTYASWLKALSPEATLSLYLHVPYCNEMCHYCGCNTKAVRQRDPIERYAEHLLQEIRLIGALSGSKRVAYLHWGGGTPSILGEDLLQKVTAELQACFDFSAIREHNIELDPRKITRSLVRALVEMGVNRVSLGVQDFSPHVQRLIGRLQPYDLVERSVALLREAGLDSINFDLMYGLPQQSLRDLEHTAKLTVKLKPSRIALFGYAHVPWFKKHQSLIKEHDLPGPQERLQHARVATDIFVAAGYQAIGLDHFAFPDDELAIAARENRLHRNFQGYTTDNADALIGLGASSIGSMPQGFVQNAPDVAGYARAVEEGRPATLKGIAFNDDDRLRAEIIERLMCDMAVDLGRYGGGAAFADELAALVPLAKSGLVTLEGDVMSVTEAGRPFIRLAAAVFDTYLPANKARHSVAV